MIFKAAYIVRWATIEGASFFAIVCYQLTGKSIFAILFIVFLVVFMLSRPVVDILEK